MQKKNIDFLNPLLYFSLKKLQWSLSYTW